MNDRASATAELRPVTSWPSPSLAQTPPVIGDVDNTTTRPYCYKTAVLLPCNVSLMVGKRDLQGFVSDGSPATLGTNLATILATK
ncbi:hypothetical protein AVEN_112200-1 [Araneus ventricosus]|uniref:Uncharacterized protein n=1 Tax=Araneus ventricosus TaxID=182803 RepID=A0A4Y2W8Z3_ARAVE|nr:hypothetical protein AVEN_112200-1 [Araneus ventricosus]